MMRCFLFFSLPPSLRAGSQRMAMARQYIVLTRGHVLFGEVVPEESTIHAIAALSGFEVAILLGTKAARNQLFIQYALSSSCSGSPD